MSNCITLTPSIQGCVNIPIIQGSTSSFTFNFDPSFPLSEYDIVMDIKQTQDVSLKPILRKTIGDGLEVDGQSITVFFGSEMYHRNWNTLVYDMLFIHNSVEYQAHLIIGRILISNSTTKP